MYKINVVKTQKNKIKLKDSMKKGFITKYPSFNIIVGKSGSGKTNLLMSLLTKPELYGNFFDYILYLSPTGKLDDSLKCLKLPEDNLITEPDEYDDLLENIFEAQDKIIKKVGIRKASKVSKICLIFDDIIGEREILKSKSLLRLASLGRHYLLHTFLLTQSWTKVPRALRIQSMGIYLFTSSMSEVELLSTEYCPPNMTKKQFINLVSDATKDRYNFLFINSFEPPDNRYRKNIDEVINLNNYKK